MNEHPTSNVQRPILNGKTNTKKVNTNCFFFLQNFLAINFQDSILLDS